MYPLLTGVFPSFSLSDTGRSRLERGFFRDVGAVLPPDSQGRTESSRQLGLSMTRYAFAHTNATCPLGTTGRPAALFIIIIIILFLGSTLRPSLEPRLVRD